MIERVDEQAAATTLAADGMRAGIWCALFMVAISLSELVNADGAAQRVTGAVVHGTVGFVVGFSSVRLGGVRRNARGGWDVTATFTALVLGTPIVVLAAFLATAMLGAADGRVAIAAAALWLAGVAAVRTVIRRGRAAPPGV